MNLPFELIEEIIYNIDDVYLKHQCLRALELEERYYAITPCLTERFRDFMPREHIVGEYEMGQFAVEIPIDETGKSFHLDIHTTDSQIVTRWRFFEVWQNGMQRLSYLWENFITYGENGVMVRDFTENYSYEEIDETVHGDEEVSVHIISEPITSE